MGRSPIRCGSSWLGNRSTCARAFMGSLAAEIAAKEALNAYILAENDRERTAAAVALWLTGLGWVAGAAAYVRTVAIQRSMSLRSTIPDSYINSRNNVDMRGANTSNTNAAGYPRDPRYYFRQLYDKHAEMFSKKTMKPCLLTISPHELMMSGVTVHGLVTTDGQGCDRK
ncbi:hypothetical protein [Kolteria novifilia]|uniref:hypothetical protein n=1 Tax=Kolteria novifilia TaxID=2527975 RepID=UPI003AF34C78